MIIRTAHQKVREFMKRRSRTLEVVFFVSAVAALLILRAVEYLAVSGGESQWDSVVNDICTRSLAAGTEEFTSQQRLIRRVATDLGSHPSVSSYLAGRRTDPTDIFLQCAKVGADQGVGIEVYDRDARLVAWYGRSGAGQLREIRIALDGQMTSMVSRSPIFSQLFVAIPVRDDGSIVGAILVRKTVQIDYPLNNAYINREGLADELSRRLGIRFEFIFSPSAQPLKDGRYASEALYGIDSTRVGVISVLKPPRSTYADVEAAKFQLANGLLLGVLMLGLAIAAGRRVTRIVDPWLRLSAAVALVWLVRFGLLWLTIPSSFLTGGIFDPALFASSFGGGLAKSIGEMSLTCFAVLLTTFTVVRAVPLRERMPRAGVLAGGVGALVSLLAILLVYGALRGLAATVRSAVFDSTLRLTDTRVMFPGIPYWALLVDLFVLSACLITLASLAGHFVARSFTGWGVPKARGWLGALLLFIVGAVVFPYLPGDPLVPVWYRCLFGVGSVAGAMILGRRPDTQPFVLRPRGVLLALAFSAVLVYPLLSKFVEEKDRQRVEGFAREVLRPVDSWFTNVVDEALGGFASPETAEALAGENPDSVSRLAFTNWAASTACREGYTSVFAVVAPDGHEVSRFSIGGETVRTTDIDTLVAPPQRRTIRVRTIGTGINAVRVYSGSTHITSPDGRLLGYGQVVVAAGQQTLFRGDNPAILRGSSGEDLESYYRPVSLSEFRDGILLTTSNPRIPIGHQLPDSVRARFEGHAGTAMWIEETIDDDRYDTYYVSREGGPADVIALGLQAQGFLWHLTNIVKVVLVVVLAMLLFLALLFARRLWRGERLLTTFRDRLLIALVLTALVPLILIATYGRYSAQQRLATETERHLDEETSTLVSYLLDQISTNAGGIRSSFTPALADQIAADLGIDFNLYIGNEMRLTSRPELYEAGILDRRLSGPAYASIMVKGRRFFLETENIGAYRYAVGYSPLLDASGAILGVVSVPTFYRQDQMEEETARRNTFLIAAYAVILLAIIILATALANRIAAPIHVLTEATTRVARGGFDVDLEPTKADGEVGELIRSFEAMTRNLKRNREELVRFEREEAWKEMAKQVAHEIKNPLTPMKLAVQHLRQTYRDRAPDFHTILDEVTATLIGQIETLSRIASEFSHFARMPRRNTEECDVNTILRESTGLFEQNPALRIQFNLQEHLPPIRADREELRRAFINIIRNGIQAMGEKGTMKISSGTDAGRVRIAFQDFGAGIPDDVRARLFEPNFSTKTDGMGLGLSIVKKTIDDLHGNITVESTVGMGTVVVIILPASDAEGKPG